MTNQCFFALVFCALYTAAFSENNFSLEKASISLSVPISHLPPNLEAADDFLIEITNHSEKTIDIAKDWETQWLIIDGTPFQVIGTNSEWCIKSSRLKPNASFTRGVNLDCYPNVSLPPGVHEIQVQIGLTLSNKIKIQTTATKATSK